MRQIVITKKFDAPKLVEMSIFRNFDISMARKRYGVTT